VGVSVDSEDVAWLNQSRTLQEVQRYGSNLEREVRNLLDWDGGRVPYSKEYGYKIQVDCTWQNLQNPLAIASVTYSNPDTPGHSNENKLQLKLGELALLKNRYPKLRAILVIGGTEEAWLPYVLKAFDYFYDEVVHLWDEKGFDRLNEIRSNPTIVENKHQSFWDSLREIWANREAMFVQATIPRGLVRYEVLDMLKADAGHESPSEIKNAIARRCMQASFAEGGTEWNHYRQQNWGAIEMSRSYFNPQEAIVDLSLNAGNFKFSGGLAKDVEVRSFLHQLGMDKTKLSEDFVLYSRALQKPVYIQCKASGGGRNQHGKNIQNRTKEQVARGILYSANLNEEGNLSLDENDFHWVGVLDGNWDVTQSEKHKYVHMLHIAGYSKLFAGSDLVDEAFDVLPAELNPLVSYLISLDCETV
jgi:hypothetical protein